jgi:hypothetical protein
LVYDTIMTGRKFKKATRPPKVFFFLSSLFVH